MPIYTYQCKKCHHKYDLLVGVTSGSVDKNCPKCGSTEVQKALTAASVRMGSSSDSICESGACSVGRCPSC